MSWVGRIARTQHRMRQCRAQFDERGGTNRGRNGLEENSDGRKFRAKMWRFLNSFIWWSVGSHWKLWLVNKWLEEVGRRLWVMLWF